METNLKIHKTTMLNACLIYQILFLGVAGQACMAQSAGTFTATGGYPGFNQVNVRVPGAIAPSAAVSVRLTYLGRPSNAVSIAVQ